MGRLHERTATGTAGNLGLDELSARIIAERTIWDQRQSAFKRSIAALVAGEYLPNVGSHPVKDLKSETTEFNPVADIAPFFAFAPCAVSRGSLELAFEVALGI